MSRNFTVFKHNQRYALDGSDKPQNPLFKTVFPTYQIWHDALKAGGVDIAQIDETEYNLIVMMVANSELRFQTDVKIKGYAAFQFQRFYSMRTKEQELYDLTPQQWVQQISTSEQKLFNVNKSDTDVIEDRFLDNAVKGTQTHSKPLIEEFNKLWKQTAQTPPKLLFLARLAQSLLYPIQTKRTKEF